MAESVVTWKTRWWFSPFLVAALGIAITTAYLMLLSRFFRGTFNEQMHAGLVANTLTFLGIGLFQSAVEWGSHRYLMHVVVVSWFKSHDVLVALSHGAHHVLTSMLMVNADPAGRTKKIVSRHVITADKQHYAVTYPWHFQFNFAIGYIIIFCLVRPLFHGVPLFLGGMIGVNSWAMLYDTMHTAVHNPDTSR